MIPLSGAEFYGVHYHIWIQNSNLIHSEVNEVYLLLVIQLLFMPRCLLQGLANTGWVYYVGIVKTDLELKKFWKCNRSFTFFQGH